MDWIREKEPLASSANRGRDLIGVQNLIKYVLLRSVNTSTTGSNVIGHVTLELSSYVLKIPNDAYTTLTQNLIGTSKSGKRTAGWLVDNGKKWEGIFAH